MELPFKKWLREQVFYRILLEIKNFQIILLKKKLKKQEIIKKKAKIIDILFFFVFFERPLEFLVYFKLVHFFVSKLNQKFNYSKTADFNYIPLKNFLQKPLGSKEFSVSRELAPTSSVEVKSIGKYFLFKGIIVQVGKTKQRIKSILMECSRCQSVFFCLFESFATDYIFFCVKKNCKSKIFFSYIARINVIFWKRLKANQAPALKDSGKNTVSIDIEIFGSNNQPFEIGDFIISKGVLKISNSEKEVKEEGIFRNIFYFYLQNHQMHIISQRIKEKKRFFLTKKEYLFFNKLKSGANLFIFFMKTLDSIFYGHNSLKAGILLLVSQSTHPSLNGFQETQRFTCLVMIDEIRKLNSFREMIDIIPKSFSFDLKNLQSFYRGKKFEKKEIDLKPILKNFLKQGKKLIYIEETEKEEEIVLLKVIQNIINITFEISKRSPFHLIAGIKPVLGFYKSDFNSFQNSRVGRKFTSFFDLIFILLKKKSNLNDKKSSKKLLKFFRSDSLISGKANGKGRCFLSKEKRNPLFGKKRFSRFFFRRIFLFVQNQINPIISENVSMLLVELYKSMEISLVNKFFSKRIRYFEIVLQLGKCRAKIDFRNTVSVEDVMDVMEIISDTTFFSRENWESIALEKKFKGFQNIWAIRKLSKKLRQRLSGKKQTIFDTRILEQNFNQESNKNEILEIIEILTKSNLIEKKNDQFFKIGKELQKIQ